MAPFSKALFFGQAAHLHFLIERISFDFVFFITIHNLVERSRLFRVDTIFLYSYFCTVLTIAACLHDLKTNET